MSTKEQGWPAYYRELLAIYLSIQHFRHMLDGCHFTIFTDHKPLVYSFKRKHDKLPPIQLNQLSFISEFSTDIQHISGSENVVADALSRIESISTPLDYQALAESQRDDKELQTFLSQESSLQLKKVLIPGSDISIYCDDSTGKLRPFVTPRFRKQIFEKFHSLSHPGIKASTKLISDRFVWPSMRKDCRLWSRTCIPCQQTKIHRHVKTPLGNFQTPSQRFSHIHVDIIGPLPPVSSFRYCLTVIDRYTRWCEVQPLQCITAEAVTLALLTCWISRFGCPTKISVDRGSQFTSHLFHDLAKRFGIEIAHTTSWHPQANGMIERLHRQLKAAIMAHQENWLEALPLVLLGIRSSFKEDLKTTSAELVFGEPLRLPGEMLSSSSIDSTEDPTLFLSRLRKIIRKLRPSPASRHGTPEYFIFKDLGTCSHVLLQVGPIRKSLQAPYTGPYEVVSRNDKTITLKINNKNINVSIDRVKPAFILTDELTPPALPVTSHRPSTAVPYQDSSDRTTRSGRRVRFPDLYKP